MTHKRVSGSGALVTAVEESSPLWGRVEPGDLILSINGRRPSDLIDLMFCQQGEDLRIEVGRRDGSRMRLRLSRGTGEPLGLAFRDPVFDGIRTCSNSCSFCFVDQLPVGLRESLYVKDDDYRLSVLQGNFITLNGLRKRDIRRILRLKLQPLYISLHTTEARLRDRMMGTGASERALSILHDLISAGLEVHLQVVLCPGVNDGAALEYTLATCLEMYPAQSLAVVPVSLLGERGEGDGLRPLSPADAAAAIETVDRYQNRALRLLGRRFCFASDEMFCLADETFPPAGYYEDWPQLENGVGMARRFIDEARGAMEGGLPFERMEDVVVVTGGLGERVLKESLSGRGDDLPVKILAVENRVFGPRVTVSGLLGGRETSEAMRSCGGYRLTLIPGNALSDGVFIDGVGMDELFRSEASEIRIVEPDGRALVEELRRFKRGEPS